MCQRGPVTVAAGADITFIAPVREGDVLVATATVRVSYGRSGIYDVTVRAGSQIVAEFRGRSRTTGQPPGREPPARRARLADFQLAGSDSLSPTCSNLVHGKS